VASVASEAFTKRSNTGKMRTFASNIAQEKMQILMQKSYYESLVTMSPAISRSDR